MSELGLTQLETKQKSSQWKSSQSQRLKKVSQIRSTTKSMHVVFFDIHRVLHRLSTDLRLSTTVMF